MFVYMGKYRNWYSTYNWKTPEWFNDVAQTVINFVWNSWYTKLSRMTKVHISDCDCWSADNTMAFIVLPILKKLKEAKCGAPLVADEDVPEELRSTNAPPTEYDHDTDDFWFDRWNYVLDSMIWSFEQLVDEYWEDQFHTGKIDMKTVPCDDGSGHYQLVDGPNHTHKFDQEGYAKYNARIDEGLRLFGKYYRGLWW